MQRTVCLAALIGVVSIVHGAEAGYVASSITPPAPPREFRGVWVATVNNIDWPSQSGLSSAQQQAELLALLDRAVHLRLNAVLLQVRPACDAIYASKLEPWSEYLTGQMGRAPKPFYDPLALAVAEAHKRGLELHAWFNPFRVRLSAAKSVISANHVSQMHPYWVKNYGGQLWLDPGEPAVRDYSLRVVLDVVKRYDVDGVHLDDYFYPYPTKNVGGGELDFPDNTSWRPYEARGGRLDRAAWRRQNVDEFVQRLYQGIKKEKPWVKFGISPFGIWRPGFPPQIKGFDAYAKLYADARKWLQQGWLDYLAPQLYWSSGDPEQSFPVLLKWWAEQNRSQRHLWPGSSIYRHKPEEVLNQVQLTRRQSGASGNILWSMKMLVRSSEGLAFRLRNEAYRQPALVPASTWLDGQPPSRPKLSVQEVNNGKLKLSWSAGNPESVWLWLLQAKAGSGWNNEVLPEHLSAYVLDPKISPDAVALSAVDRCGNVSLPAVYERAINTDRKRP